MELEQVTYNYDRAASWYDAGADWIFSRLLGIERYRETTIGLLGDLEGATVLDVGCGTGRNFPLLAPRVGPRGRVIGIDYSEGMLGRARARIDGGGWRNVEVRRGDAVKLDVISEPVDAVVSVWCLGIVHDLEAALHRAIDVLRPGGRIAIMDFGRSRPDRGVLHWLYPFYALLLRRSGIDSPEDLDDSRLRARWERGRDFLRARLDRYEERTYLQGSGLILSGARPSSRWD
jgi:ubiquinone/menaquinone biosynthesis C-methylase UbiE